MLNIFQRRFFFVILQSNNLRVLATTLKTRIMNRNKFSLLFLLLATLFCVCLIVSNLIEIKIIDIGVMTITAGMLVFPISYIINDCLVEVYGFRKARFVIWLGFAMNLMFTLFLMMAVGLPRGINPGVQEAMETVFGYVPRVLLASFTAFICGSMVNAYVMSKMKRRSKGRHFSYRAILSTVFGELTDSIIFFPVAFWGIIDPTTIISLILTQAALKTVYEIIILPVTIRVVRLLKEFEGVDYFDDESTSYKWWRITDV